MYAASLLSSRLIYCFARRFLASLLFSVPVVMLHYTVMIRATSCKSCPIPVWPSIVMFMLSTPVQVILGWPFLRRAYLHLVKTSSSGMDMLVALGTWSSYAYSIIVCVVWWCGGERKPPTFETSVMLLTFVSGGKMLEDQAKGRSGEAIRELMKLKVEYVQVVCTDDNGGDDDDENYESLPRSGVQVGSRV